MEGNRLIDCIHVSTYVYKMGYERTTWKRRWAVLDGRNFVYFKSDSDMVNGRKPRGEGRLTADSDAVVIEGRHECVPDSYAGGSSKSRRKVLESKPFSVEFGPLGVRQRSSGEVVSSRTYYLRFENSRDMQNWIDAVKRNVAVFYSADSEPDEINADSLSLLLPHSKSDLTRKSWKFAQMGAQDQEWHRVNVVASRGSVSDMIALSEGGIDIISPTENEGRPLVQAAVYGNLSMITFLLGRGAAIDAKTAQGNTALHGAAKHGQTEAVSLLMSHGADLSVKNAAGQTPADCCVLKETYSHITGEMAFPPWPQPITPAEQAVEAELLANVRSKIEVHEGWDFDVVFVHMIASSGKLSEIVAAHRAGLPIHAPQPDSGSTPMMIAAGVGNCPVLIYLIENGADLAHVSNKGNTALHLAARRCGDRGHVDCVKILVNSGANADAQNDDRETPYDVCGTDDCKEVLRLDDVQDSTTLFPPTGILAGSVSAPLSAIGRVRLDSRDRDVYQ